MQEGINAVSERSLFSTQWGKPEAGREALHFIMGSLEELAGSGFGIIHPGLLSHWEQMPALALERSPCLGEAMRAQAGGGSVG